MVSTVRRAKRGRVQQFPIKSELSNGLLQYIKYARPQCSCQHLFISLYPRHVPMCPGTVSTIVSERTKRLGISLAKMSPHSLRHACATELLRQGTSLQEIADFLGHRDSQCVGIYAKFNLKNLHHVSVLDPCVDL
jgi:site-specific recombinase XerD